MWSCSPKLKGNALAYDVTFRFENSSFNCEKSVFGAASPLFKQIFEAAETDEPQRRANAVGLKVHVVTDNLIIDLDEAPEVFEAIHKFLHNPEHEIEPSLLPSVCNIAKKFNFPHVWHKCGKVLAQSITIDNIGEVCPLVTLSGDPSMEEDPTAQELTAAVKAFLAANADSIASSQTGQLSARLFIDVLEGPPSPNHNEPASGTESEPDDWCLSERVLRYCSRRVQDREPLDEGNCLTFEDKAARKLNNKIHASANDTVTDEIRMTISDHQLTGNGKATPSQLSTASSETGDQGNLSEAVACTPSPPPLPPQTSAPSPTSATASKASSSYRSGSATDKETCLLAKTSLGVGSISIHLGKLEGRLVSISVKRRRIPSGPASSASSSVAGGGGGGAFVFPLLSASPQTASSVIIPPSPPHDSPNHTPSQVSLRAAVDAAQDETFTDYGGFRRGSVFLSLGSAASVLLEPRSNAGAVVLCSTENAAGEEGDFNDYEEEDESPPPRRSISHYVLVAGGTSQVHCLSSTEVIRITRPATSTAEQTEAERRGSVTSTNSDLESASAAAFWGAPTFSSVAGPRMRSARGRLALATLEGSSNVYAIGGCSGTEDLATVEKLSFEADGVGVGGWTVSTAVAPMQQARSCCAAASAGAGATHFLVVVGGQSAGSPLASAEAYRPDADRWLSLPSMADARSQLCACSLPSRNLVLAVGGVSETSRTPSMNPSHCPGSPFAPAFSAVSPSFLAASASAAPLSSSGGEALDIRCAQWIRLPELLSRGPVIGAALVPLSPASGRLLLIGGSDGLSTLTQTQIFDSRGWCWLPGPSLSIGRACPCAVSLATPGLSSQPPCIAVFGGYNLEAGGFLNSVEIVGTPWGLPTTAGGVPFHASSTPAASSTPHGEATTSATNNCSSTAAQLLLSTN